VRTSRRLVAWITALALLGLCVPAVTIASGGGSAGDQQYTDPFAGTPTKPQTTPSAPAATTPAPAATTPAPAATPTTAVSPSAATTPAQTIGSTTVKSLPYTGYDGWLAAGFGLTLLGGGLVLRRHTRRS
jgi:LPXTG-motif cell wall-anchored protein